MSTSCGCDDWILKLERASAGDLVTVVRYRITIEEKVMLREEFNKINSLDPKEDYPDLELDYNTKENFDDWGFGSEQDFIPREILGLSKGYMVFDGDVRVNTDDYVAFLGKWETEFPLTVV